MIKLNPLFSDGAIFQQHKTIPVWGWGVSDHQLMAEFAGLQANTKVAGSGKFMFRFPPVVAGGPFCLTVTDLDSGEKVVINDILVGEVWLASGQSNMEYSLGTDWVKDKDEEYHSLFCVNRIQEKEYCDTIKDSSTIRFITIEKRASGLEEETFNGQWKCMTKDNAHQASAVAAWFARFVQEKINVPIGLVIAAWGGTIVEAWTSRAGLLSNPETAPLVYEVDTTLNGKDCWNRPEDIAFELPIALEKCLDQGNEGFAKGWADFAFDDSQWRTMKIPGSWISQKISGNGAVWVRKEIEIPPSWLGKDLVLNMGGIDKHDVTYFNGVRIGGIGEGIDVSSWEKQRQYKIPQDLVKSGKNVLAVRAYSFMYDGAFLGLNRNYYINPVDWEDKIFIYGEWKVKAELDLGIIRPIAALSGPGNSKTPGILFNSMIRPLIPFAIRGVIWYQGETNANVLSDASTYEGKISTMIKDWRYQWGQGDFPFIQTQLANYSPTLEPEFVVDSCWAFLREAQRTVCEKISQVYMCTAVDVGELTDIHPQNKKIVGLRMAFSALYNVYGYENIVPFGPLYFNHSIEGNSIRIYFRYSEGLKIKENLPQSFYVAGKDHEFYPATSVKIEGNSIVVNCSNVPKPFAVRYGWSDAAVTTLYNAANLPASPFRTDNWNAIV